MTTVTVWGGSSSTDWHTAANWTNGVPTTSLIASIPSAPSNQPNMSSDGTTHALQLDSGATLTGGSNITLYITGESAGETDAPPNGMAVNLDGAISGELSLNITTNATTSVDLNATSGDIHDLTLASTGTSLIINSENTCTLTGDLTITKGKFNANSNNLSVAGTITVNSVAGGDAEIDIGDVVADCAKIVVESGDTITAAHSSNALTVDGNGIGTGRSIDFTGIISGTLDIICTHPNTTEADLSASSGVINHLTLNHASLVMKMNSSATVGNLTITSGEFHANDAGGAGKNLTVTSAAIVTAGKLDLDAASSDGNAAFGTLTINGGEVIAAGAGSLTVTGQCEVTGTLTCSSGAVSVGSGLTNTLGMYIKTNGTLVGGSGAHTYGTFNADASGTVTVTLTSDTTTINGSFSDGIAWAMRNGVTFNNGGGDIHFTGTANQYLYERNNTARTLGDVVVNKSGGTLQWYNGGGAVYTMATLTVTAGTYSSVENTSGTSKDLTVTGQVLVNGGTLALGAATCDFGDVSQSSGIIYGQTSTINLNTGTGGGWVWYRTGGTWDYGTSTVVYKSNGKHMEGEFYNLTIECASSTHTGVWRADGLASVIMKCANNLTVKEGIWKRDAAAETMTIDGNASIESGGTLGNAGESGPNNFGGFDIASGGTYTATSGDTSITSGNFNNSGTFTHSDGMFKFTHATNTQNMQSAGSVVPVFYKLDTTQPAVGGATVVVWKSITVIHTLSQTGGRYFQFKGDVGSLTVTLGSSTVACTVTEGNRCLATLSGAGPVNIYGADQLKPFVITTGGPNHACTEVHYKWGDYSADSFTTQHNITIDGDMKFGAMTVASGDELDLNGQRVEFSGVLSGGGAMNANNSTLIFTGTSGTVFDGGEGPDLSITDSTDCTFICDAGSGSQVWKNRFQSSDATIFVKSGTLSLSYWNWEDITNFFVGGTFDNSSANRNVTTDNLTIPTGGTLSAGSGTLTMSGDFTTSGGLIGKSALVFDNSGDYVDCGYDASTDITNTLTMTAWIKSTGTDSYEHIICKQGGYYFLSIIQHGGVGKAIIRIYDGANIDAMGTSQINDGKWHHIAGTYDTSAGKLRIYVDGKLEAETDNSDAISHGSSKKIFIGANDTSSNIFNGTIAQASLWNVALTEAQIRTKIFSDFAGLDSNTGCIGWWQFDEGSGADVDNKGSEAADLDGTITGATWVGAGTFTYGTSTVKMTGTGGKKINYTGDFSVYKLTIATGGDSNAITMNEINGNNGGIVVYHTLQQESGKLGSTTNEYIQIGKTFGNVLVASGKGAIALADVAKIFIFQNGQTGTMNFPSASSADKDLTIKRLFVTSDSSIEVLCQGDLTVTTEIKVADENKINVNGNTLTPQKITLEADSTLNIQSSTVDFPETGGLYSQEGCILIGGPGAVITAHSTRAIFDSQGHWEIVGNIHNLNVTENELVVHGQVTNCIGDIHQWLPHFERDVMLDSDTSSDTSIDRADDIDRNNELIN